MTMKRCIVPGLIALIATIAALAQSPAPVAAHTYLLRAEPGDGTVIANGPGSIRLWFSDGLVPEFTTAELRDSRGTSIPVTWLPPQPDQIPAGGQGPSRTAFLLDIEIPALAPDTYQVLWQTRATDDLHAISGVVVFGIRQVPPLPVASAAPDAARMEIALRWILFYGLACTIGALALALICVPSAPATARYGLIATERIRRRLFGLARVVGSLAASAATGLLLVQLVSLPDPGTAGAVITSSPYGRRWLGVQALLVLLVILLGWSRRGAGARARWSRRALVPVALALLAVQALEQHAGGSTDPALLRLGVDFLHLTAASLWTGGVAALLFVIVTRRRQGRGAPNLTRDILGRFGALALGSLVTLIATGLYKTGQGVASPDALLLTLYGQALILKIALVSIVGALGLANAALVRRGKFRPGRIRVLLVAEAVAGGLVLLSAAVLGTVQPARGPAFDPPAAPPPVQSLTGAADDLLVTLAIRPNRPGTNFVSLTIFNTRRPAPAPVGPVTLRLNPLTQGETPLILSAKSVGDGRYQVDRETVTLSGAWQASVDIGRPGLPDAHLTVPWTVGPEEVLTATRPVVVSNRPLAPVLDMAASIIGLLACGVLLALVTIRRYRCRRRSHARQIRLAPGVLDRGL